MYPIWTDRNIMQWKKYLFLPLELYNYISINNFFM